MRWVDENGEIHDECPDCVRYEANLQMMEREARNYRAKITRLENDAERNIVAKRDGATWKALLAYWQAAFPDRRVTSKGIKSARATKVFQRLEAGATTEDIQYAVDAAKVWQWVVYGKRQKSGSKSDLAVDLEHIVSIGNDAQFDDLVAKGRAMSEDVGW